ncbi:MAG: DUF1450 domain-containing protein [Geobacteraceae bacterium]|nr:DUF1450 domain-containing protein [Geobacteraceae bacterium]
MKVRLCQHNKGADQLVQRLQAEFVDLNIKLKKCVKQCKICKKQPFAMVAKKVILASDTDRLYADLVGLFDQIKQAEK